MSDAPPRRCAVCGAGLAERQRWCLTCGSATLTAVAGTPRWRLTAVLAALLGVLALVGVGDAVATLAQS